MKLDDSAQLEQRRAFARTCFLRACELDVAVRKPGNVSAISPGHGMQAGQFLASARAAVEPLFEARARVGPRIESAVAATWVVVHCNTNLGIVLLCAPIAAAIEDPGALGSAASLRSALESVLADLDLEDTRCTYRAIAQARPAGLGRVAAEDVHTPPRLALRGAMALAAQRDSIARQYASGFEDIFKLGFPLLYPGFSLTAQGPDAAPSDAAVARVQQVYLSFLSHLHDSHIVRKHGAAAAHTVMSAAQDWVRRAAPNTDPAFAAWDEALKAQDINPGTSADLCVATMLLAGLLGGPGAE
ncbi:MAG: triphosphoribosyl-dephospho-CoA synthase [Burkholderiaceae bacterium]